jgi:HEAT repeat protein
MMLMTTLRLTTTYFFVTVTMVLGLRGQSPTDPSQVNDSSKVLGLEQAANPYQLEPFVAGFPVELDYPPMLAKVYDRSRRQILQQLAGNLQGNVRREAWQLATEFFWRAPEDAVEPLIEAMDRAMSSPALSDVVNNCVEAMGKMANPDFDGALLRALQHKKESVRQMAYVSLGRSGSTETIKKLRADFVQMNGRARQAWLTAIRERLPKERVAMLRAVMMAEYPTAVRDQVLKETVKLPPSEAAEVLKGRWFESVDEFKAVIAGALHAAGDGSGTAWLQQSLNGEDKVQMLHALRHCAFGLDADAAIGNLRDDLLKATTHVRPEVRLEAAKQLTRLTGDDVADVFEVLAAPNEVWDIRGLAVRELTKRGRDSVVTVLLDELPTATGSRVPLIINQLSVSGDPRAVPLLVDRFMKAPEGEGRSFLQAISQNASPAAAKALCTIFEGPDRLVSRSNRKPLTTRSYIPLLLLNARGSEQVILEAFINLKKDDWAARSLLMPTIVGFAIDRREQTGLGKLCIEPIRAILFDRDELPQLRVQALNLLARNWLTIDDVLRLKRNLYKEQSGFRALIENFLNNYF